MRVRRRSKKKSGITAITFVLLTLFFVVTISIADLNAKSAVLKQKEEKLMVMINEAEQRNETLKERETYIKTKKFIEEIAREKLGLVNPDETIFKANDN